MNIHTKIIWFTILGMWKDSVIPLYLFFRYVNGYFEEINGNKYLVLVPINESKKNIKKNMKNCGLK